MKFPVQYKLTILFKNTYRLSVSSIYNLLLCGIRQVGIIFRCAAPSDHNALFSTNISGALHLMKIAKGIAHRLYL